jgi:carbon storage regulator
MLIISRKKNQKLIIADDIEITILEVGKNRVRFGIKAPQQVRIYSRLKDSPASEQTSQVVEMPSQSSPLESLSAVAGIGKSR